MLNYINIPKPRALISLKQAVCTHAQIHTHLSFFKRWLFSLPHTHTQEEQRTPSDHEKSQIEKSDIGAPTQRGRDQLHEMTKGPFPTKDPETGATEKLRNMFVFVIPPHL